ncbi:MAG: type II toxin-antitoxin system mRNA interferase toxin, RelE/StbE family [Candidatus Taylorbacteria bacterium]|nr:type II toxin-antitoxin system mRNA interferase toxin, RelE/StbE family [Candidatus Taylorbacteria bacterium]
MRIDFHRTFKKQYKRAPAKIREQFNERLQLFEDNPFHPLLVNHALGGDRLGKWSINITGNWRALYEFQNAETIIFAEIGTHPQLYG